MNEYDFAEYLRLLIAGSRIEDVAKWANYRVGGGNPCMACGRDKLYVNAKQKSFRCLHQACLDHGDLIGLLQRRCGCSFSEAVKTADGGNCLNYWSPEYLENFGKVRDCLAAATRFYHLQPSMSGDAANKARKCLKEQQIDAGAINDFMIGTASGKTELKDHLLQKDFPI